MNTRDRTLYDALRRARHFIQRHRASLGSLGAGPIHALDQAIALLGKLSFARWANELVDEALRTSMHSVRRTLRIEVMRPVITIARERLRGEVELQALQLPKRHATLATFILTANTLADVVARHRNGFEREGLPRDTVQRLREGAESLAQAAGRRERLQASRVEWRSKMDEKLRQARGDLAIIDVSVRALLRTNGLLAAEWAVVRRSTGPVAPEYRLRKSA